MYLFTLLLALLFNAPLYAQTTIVIPQDPAIGALQQQVQTLQTQVKALQAPATQPAPPLTPFDAALKLYEQHMIDNGKATCTGTYADSYYDSPRVFYQIADYTHDPSWNACAKNGITLYRDNYLVPNHYGAAGWDIFPHGLLMDFQRTGDTVSKDAVLGLATKSAYAPSYPLDWTASADSSREVAYNIMAKLLAVSQGGTVWGLDEQVEQAFNHITQWTNLLNGKPSGTKASYVRPFMAALTSEALIQWAGDDPARQAKVLAALQPLWDQVWYLCWLKDKQSMMYTNVIAADGTGGQDPAPDLNLLIAPAYAWLYAQTKQAGYRDKADALFIGGVNGAFLSQGKQFNQNYRWSIQGLKWRG